MKKLLLLHAGPLRKALFWVMPLLGTHVAQAQTSGLPIAFMGEKATIAACVRDISGDSVALFFDKRYYLTPVACATIRRHTHLTPKGDFDGETWDYNIDTNRLLYRMHYRQAQRDGHYEGFYPNGQMAVRGQFAKGEPTGSWEFWYANGQRKQTFELTGQLNPRLRIMAYWDSTGQQGVADGNGRWQDVMPVLKRRYGGPVLAGLPQDIWESRAVETDKLLTVEMYDNGVFKSGKSLEAGTMRYKNHSLLEPQIADPCVVAEQVQLGKTCESMRAYDQQMATMRQQRLVLQNSRVTPPKPPGNTTSYLQALLKNLDQTNQRNQWENMVDGQQFTIRATTDAEGFLRIVGGQGGSGIVTAVSQAVASMARWKPATVNDKPTPGEVRFLVVKIGVQLNISMQANATL